MRRCLGCVSALLLASCVSTAEDPEFDASTQPIWTDAGEPERDAGAPAHAHDAGEPDAAFDGAAPPPSPEQDAAPAPAPAEDAAAPSPAPRDKVPVFVATGNCGRHLMSCDGGRSWIHDVRDEANCPESQWYEGHATHTSVIGSVAYGEGAFVAAWGWGANGPVLRSTDGVEWTETSVSRRGWFGGVAYGNGRFVLGAPRDEGWFSTDQGETWSRLSPQDGFQNGSYRVRSTNFVGGRFVMMDHDGGRAAQGEVWSTATGSGDFKQMARGDTRCLPWTYAEGNGVVLGIQWNELADQGLKGMVCRVVDDFGRFERVYAGDHVREPLIFSAGQFHFWSNGRRYSSDDGRTWSDTPLSGGFRGDTQAIAYAEELGVYVAITSNWSNRDQRAYRSEDGVHWTEVPFSRGPAIPAIAFGYVPPSAQCPLP